MEKINIALTEIEDNAVAIRELDKKLLRRTKCRLVSGTVADGNTTFGQITSDGGVGVVITFPGTSATLKFGGATVITGRSPIIAVLPAGTGEAVFPSVYQGALALIIGG